MPEQRIQVAAAMHDSQNQHVLAFYAVKNYVLADRGTAAGIAKVLFAGTTDVRKFRKHQKRSVSESMR